MTERVIVVGCQFPDTGEQKFQMLMDELKELVHTAGGEVVGHIIQNRQKPDPATYIGSGKLEELMNAAETLESDLIVFNDELSAGQVRNLDANLNVKIIDRTQIILDIFANRAHTKEGKIQVELAQLMYLLPRLSGQGQMLSRLGGGIGTRGPGETKLETDRRHIQKRMDDLKKQLEAVRAHRESYRKQRRKNNAVQFALVGYTNAGKSTLLQKLSGAETFQEDLLFATLDPLTRQAELPSGYKVLLTDTVGFIQDLPTTLIAAFRSTLEEVKEADILLHVVDVSHPEAHTQMQTVDKLLDELGANSIPVITVYNKRDKLEGYYNEDTSGKSTITISSFSDDDIMKLKQVMEKTLIEHMRYYRLFIPVSQGKDLATIQQFTLIQQEELSEEGDGYSIEGYVLVDHPVNGTIRKYERQEKGWGRMTPEEQLIEKLSERAEKKTREQREHVEAVAERNQQRLLNIFHEEKVSAYHFQSSTGYGYDDIGRETLDQVYAKIFGTEKAIVRHQFISGTHAITTALFGNLRPGDHLVYAGMPYDTLQTVIGISGNEPGSLSEYDISCTVAPLADDGYPSVEVLLTHVKPETKIVAFQRSKGYAMRPSISIETLRTLIHDIKKARPDLIVFVDNCYGEFVEELEPGHVGADLLAGSLIKNPGGGIAKSGGYIAGNATLVDRAASRFAAPGIGLEGGATSDMLLDMFQGLFLAPHTVSQAVAGALYTSAICEECGLNTLPHYKETRTDLIQAVVLEDRERMIRFCQAIQEASPVDSNVSPYPSSMPGYEDEVIMAGGTFIQGSSIEFSADGPMREPYITYVQGGLTTSHVKIAVKHALVTLIKEGLLRLPASHHGKIN